MSLQEIKNLKNEKGFTIVELLIVIVVIGILAAIVIVAFNGVQNQARVTGFKSDIASITKMAEAYNADESTNGYPLTAADFHGYTNVRLPANIRLAATPITTGTALAAGNTTVSVTGTVKTYAWRSCGATGGVAVFFWDTTVTPNAVKTATAGTCS